MALRVCIAGAGGRMGQTLLAALHGNEALALTAALEHAASPLLGHDAGASTGARLEVPITADIDAAIAASDVLIDFTRPEATLAHLAACRRHQVSAVIGTTGFAPSQRAEIAELARAIPLVLAPNMSVGVNVTLKLIDMAARALDTSYDIEIVEAHHRLKVDAPSGTAIMMGEVAAQARGTSLADAGVYGREGVIGERRTGSIGFATLRGGDIIGDHTVVFAGTGERIEISHKASSRANYAKGAFLAAAWLAGRPPGLYDMHDVLGLK